MVTKQERLEIAQDNIDIAEREVDKTYYVGPAVVFFTGLALGFLPASSGGTVLDVVFYLTLFGGIGWFIFRAIQKAAAERKYRDAVQEKQDIRREL